LNQGVPTDNNICVSCEPGKYSAVKSVECRECNAAQYSLAAASVCLDCPPDSNSPNGTGAVTGCSCNAGFQGNNGDTCTACAAGKYKTVPGESPCVDCPENTYNPQLNSTSPSSCLSCPLRAMSRTSSSSRGSCKCVAGYYGDLANNLTCGDDCCSECPAGTYREQIGALNESDCMACPTRQTSGFKSVNLTDCVCTEGYFGPPGSACAECPANTFNSRTNATNLSECLYCPSNAFSAAASHSLTNCGCETGYYGDFVNGTRNVTELSLTCNPCPPGTYNSRPNQKNVSSCLACPSNTNSPAASKNQTNCICNSGFHGVDGTTCEACPQRTYKNFTGNFYVSNPLHDCYNCPVHTWSAEASHLKSNCTCEKGYTAGICSPDYACNASLFENALGLDGAPGSRALFGPPAGVVSTGITVGFSLRIHADTLQSFGNRSILSLTCNGVSQFRFSFQNNTHLLIGGDVLNAGVPTSINNLNDSSVWTHWALGFDFAQMSLVVYTNGVATTAAMNASLACYHNLSVGAVAGDPADEPVSASIDDLVLYTRALSGPEVASLASMQGRKIASESALVGVYDFNGVEASTVVDTSGRSNHAVLSGGASILRGHGRWGDLACDKCTNDYHGPDGLACVACLAGTYKDRNGTIRCSDCPLASHSIPASPQSHFCKCNGGYTGPDGQNCTECVMGKYKQTSGSHNCTDCPTNTHSSIASHLRTNCTCRLGYFGNDGEQCEACPQRTYKNFTGNFYVSNPLHDCYNCPVHTWSAEASHLKSNCTCEKGYTAGICSPDYACNASLFENALGLDGAPGSRALFGPPAGVVSTGITVGFSLRIHADTLQSFGNRSILSLTCNGVSQFRFSFQNNTHLLIGGDVLNAGVPTSINNLNDSSVWTHWALGFDFAQMSLVVYTNGVATTAAMNASLACYHNLSVGAVAGDPADEPVSASIDDLVLYTRALSGPEVASLASMQGRKIASESALVGVYDFNGVEASTVVDTSGRSNHAVLSGGASILRGHGRWGDLACDKCTNDYHGPDGLACVACLAGTYKDRNGTIRCSDCPLASHSIPASPQSHFCKCNGGYTGPDGQNCTECVMGKYKQTSGSHNCTDCPTNTYTFGGGAAIIIQNCSCIAGYFPERAFMEAEGRSNGLGAPCEACLPGTYKPSSGAHDCTDCPSNSFTVTDKCLLANLSYLERLNCDLVAFRYYGVEAQLDPTVSVAAPRKGAVNLTDCQCEPGYTGDVAEGDCQTCPVAQYKEAFGNNACVACENCTEGFSTCTIRFKGFCEPCKNGPARSRYLGPGVIRPEFMNNPNAGVVWAKSFNCTDVLRFNFGIVTRVLKRQCYKTYYEPGSCPFQCQNNGENICPCLISAHFCDLKVNL
jgi:hypothetical protein